MNSPDEVKPNCPGDEFQCPLKTTCCKVSGGQYGCCPFEEVCIPVPVYWVIHISSTCLCNYRELAVLISCTAAHKDLNVELEMSVSMH